MKHLCLFLGFLLLVSCNYFDVKKTTSEAILNEELKSVKLFASGDNEGGIYEVLRVLDGVPLFFRGHGGGSH